VKVPDRHWSNLRPRRSGWGLWGATGGPPRETG
jgi:hypothetical protein